MITRHIKIRKYWELGQLSTSIQIVNRRALVRAQTSKKGWAVETPWYGRSTPKLSLRMACYTEDTVMAQKFNNSFLVPSDRTENFIQVCPRLFELSCFQRDKRTQTRPIAWPQHLSVVGPKCQRCKQLYSHKQERSGKLYCKFALAL